MKKFYIYILLALLPLSTFAAKIDVSLEDDSSKDGTVLLVRINSEGKNINVVEGTILFKPRVELGRLYLNPDTTGSVMTLWPNPPQYDEQSKTLHFVGGVPNGFTGDETLLKIKLSSRVSGQVEVSLSDTSAYLNDGKGTLESIESNKIDVEVKSVSGDNSSAYIRNILFASAIIILISIVIFALFRYGNKKNT